MGVMNATLVDQLKRFADSDLRAARKQGEILVTQTKRGTVALRHEGGVYTLTTQGPNATVLASGKAAVARECLVSLYTVVAA
jgi:hypothetical protein